MKKINALKVTAWILLFLPLFDAPCFAHKVYVFAWTENGHVVTQSSFSEKRAVAGGEITVADETGKILLEGKTSQEGVFSFTIPENVKAGLVIKLDAGMGHRAEWRVTSGELKKARQGKHTQKEAIEKKNDTIQKPGFLNIVSGIGLIFVVFYSLSVVYRRGKAKGKQRHQ